MCHLSPKRILGEETGRGAWERNLEEEYVRGIWERNLGEESGRGIWERNLGEEFGRGIWERNLGEKFGRGIWERNLREESGRNQGTQSTRRHPGGTQGTQEVRLGSEIKVCQIICVFSTGCSRPAILPQRERGDPHDLRSLCTKVGGHSATESAHHHHPSRPLEPLQSRTVWGKINILSAMGGIRPQQVGPKASLFE